MKIYDFPPAPNPTKLRIYLGEKGIEIPHRMVNLVKGEQNDPAFRALNPLGAVPVLELARDRRVHEAGVDFGGVEPDAKTRWAGAWRRADPKVEERSAAEPSTAARTRRCPEIARYSSDFRCAQLGRQRYRRADCRRSCGRAAPIVAPATARGRQGSATRRTARSGGPRSSADRSPRRRDDSAERRALSDDDHRTMGLLGHQWAAVRAGHAELSGWLELAGAFGAETDPDVLLQLRGPLI